MPEYDPSRWPSYGAYLRDKNIQTRPGGWSTATHDRRREYRSEKDGRRVKVITDTLGNDTIQHGKDQQSVHLRQPVVRAVVSASTGQVVS